MDVAYLADYPQWIPIIAGWFYQQWNYFYAGQSLKDVEDRIASRTNYDRIPLTLVAVKDERVIGTVCLKEFDMKTRKNLSPWLAGLYIEPVSRRRGVGSLLVKTIEEKAGKVGVKKLYLYTEDAERFYIKLGWSVLERTEYYKRKVTIMEKELDL